MRTHTSLLIAGFALLSFSAAVEADPIASWSNVGSGCVLDSSSVSNAVVNSQDGSVTFGTGKTGYILMTCPVTAPLSFPDCVGLGLSSLDPDAGSGTNYFTGAWLDFSPKGNSAAGTLLTVNRANTGMGREYDTIDGSVPFDFSQTYYWVNVWLYRGITTSNPVFYGVMLFNAGVC
jgi:hypothetical protein